MKNLKIKHPDNVYTIIHKFYKLKTPLSETIRILNNAQWEFEIEYFDLKELIDLAVRKIYLYHADKALPEINQIEINNTEIDYLRVVGNSLTPLEQKRLKCFLWELLIYAKRHPHPSGWIEYPENKFKNVPPFIKQVAFREGLEFRVVGKKNPIVCFKLNFMINADNQDATIVTKETNIEELFCALLL